MGLIDATKAIESIDEIVCSMSVCINSDYCHGMTAMKDAAIHAIEEQTPVDAVQFKWISVNDRLPKPRFAREWYLVALESGCVESLAFERDRNEWWETGSPVTHWMELPEPPTTSSKRLNSESRNWNRVMNGKRMRLLK